jgi:hypothetical protein
MLTPDFGMLTPVELDNRFDSPPETRFHSSDPRMTRLEGRRSFTEERLPLVGKMMEKCPGSLTTRQR